MADERNGTIVPKNVDFRSARLLAAMTLADQAIVSGTRLLTTVLVGRTCGADGLGAYALGFTFVVVPSCLVDSLIAKPYAVMREKLPLSEKKQYELQCFLQLVVLAAVSFACCLVASLVVKRTAEIEISALTMYTTTVALPFLLAWEFARRMSFARLRVEHALLVDVSVFVLSIVMLGAYTYQGTLSPPKAYLAMGIACAVSAAAWSFVTAQGYACPAIDAFRKFGLQNWRFGRWLALSQLVAVIHSYIVLWSLTWIGGVAAAGEFTAIETIVLLCNPLLLAAGNVATPLFARTYEREGANALREKVTRCCVVVVFLAIGFTAFVGCFGESLMHGLFQKQFVVNRVVLCVLASGTVWWGVSVLCDGGLVAMGLPNQSLVARLGGLAVTAASVIPLIIGWGLLGGAIALILGSVSTSVLQLGSLLSHRDPGLPLARKA